MVGLSQYIMQRLLQYVEYLGHSPFVICQKVQSDYSGIMNQSLSFSEEQIEEMWKICIELTNIPELGFHLGQYLSIESMGTFGMLLQNVSNIHEGLEVASNFTGLVSDYFMIDLSVDDKEFTVSLSPEKSFREAFPVRTKQGCLITYSLMIKMYAVLTMKKPRLIMLRCPHTYKTDSYFHIVIRVEWNYTLQITF